MLINYDYWHFLELISNLISLINYPSLVTAEQQTDVNLQLWVKTHVSL